MQNDDCFGVLDLLFAATSEAFVTVVTPVLTHGQEAIIICLNVVVLCVSSENLDT